jgi:hypothetical protein
MAYISAEYSYLLNYFILQVANFNAVVVSVSNIQSLIVTTRHKAKWFKVKLALRLTVSQSVSLGVEPHLGLMTRYLLLFDSYGLVFVGGALSDERMGLFFVYAAGTFQHSHSRVRVPWDS